IRDFHVTGVQTCALPIYERALRMNLIDNRTTDKATYDTRALLEFTADLDTLDGTGYDPGDLDDIRASLEEAEADPGFADEAEERSEERRVGKESRARGQA